MRILWHGYSPHGVSGMSIVGTELAKRLAMAHDVTIFGINYSGQQIDWNGCKLVQNGFLNDPNGSQMLPYWVANINPDVYITNLNWQSISWIHNVLNQRYINGRPLGVFLYVPIETEHYPPFIEEKLVKNHLNDVFLIPFNEPQYEMLKHLDAVVDYIPHGYDRNSYYPRPQARQQVRRWLGVDDRFVVMSCGENWRRKNWHILVQAFKKLQEMVDNPALIMHTSPAPSRGDAFWGGHYLNALLNAYDLKLNQDVFVTRNNPVEPTPPDTLAQLYSAADVYALPSGGEGFSLTSLESMACGLPQVSSNLENIKWLCDDASLYAETLLEDVMSTGEVVKIPDPDDFAGKLKWLHDNPDKRKEMGEKGLERAKQFSWEKSAQKFLDLLEKYENGELKGQSSWRYRRYQR